LVKRKSELQKKPALDNSARKARVRGIPTHSAEDNGVVARKFVESLIGEHLTCCQEVCRTQVVVGSGDLNIRTHGGAQSGNRFSGNFWANTITTDDSKIQG
jgi:hypothetical protein